LVCPGHVDNRLSRSGISGCRCRLSCRDRWLCLCPGEEQVALKVNLMAFRTDLWYKKRRVHQDLWLGVVPQSSLATMRERS